jgi:hypothetical protein
MHFAKPIAVESREKVVLSGPLLTMFKRTKRKKLKLGPKTLHQTQKRAKIRVCFVIDFAPILTYAI